MLWKPGEREQQKSGGGLARGSAFAHEVTCPQEGFQYLLKSQSSEEDGGHHTSRGSHRERRWRGKNAVVPVRDEFLLSFFQFVQGDIGKEAKGVMMKATPPPFHRGTLSLSRLMMMVLKP